jgi:arginine/lysine/ornithine decarboxylase
MPLTTPICDFINEYIKRKNHRLHMPGHKGIVIPGNPVSQLFPYDITEIRGADFLLSAKGIILESEQNAAEIFNTLRTVYSAEGSTLCVKTMLAMVFKDNTSKFCNKGSVIATRKAHRSFSDACTLLHLDVIWADTADEIESALQKDKNAKCVYITSPDYFGRLEDIRSLSEMVHSYNRLLLVDNAHGSYLKFLDGKALGFKERAIHPVDLGADLVCDSAHKTLPVLTGGAYLHICNPRFTESYKEIMRVFASTSPSYLILQSLDYCNLLLSEPDYIAQMRTNAEKIRDIKLKLNITTPEPCKIAVKTASSAGKICEMYNVEPEYVSDSVLLFMFSGSSTDSDIEAAESVLERCELLPSMTQKDEHNALSGLGYSG